MATRIFQHASIIGTRVVNPGRPRIPGVIVTEIREDLALPIEVTMTGKGDQGRIARSLTATSVTEIVCQLAQLREAMIAAKEIQDPFLPLPTFTTANGKQDPLAQLRTVMTEIETIGQLAGHQKGRAEKGILRIETVSVSVSVKVIVNVIAIETGTRAIENGIQDLTRSRL